MPLANIRRAERPAKLATLSAHRVGLMHCNEPKWARAALGLGRVETLGRISDVERSSSKLTKDAAIVRLFLVRSSLDPAALPYTRVHWVAVPSQQTSKNGRGQLSGSGPDRAVRFASRAPD